MLQFATHRLVGPVGPEPPGPYLVFVGDCTVPAPMGDYGSTLIAISR